MQPSLFNEETFPPEPLGFEKAAEADRLCARVVLNRPLDIVFDYLVPDSLRDMIEPGQRVRVPFGKGNRYEVGYCVGIARPKSSARRLKTLDSILDVEPLLSSHMLELTQWIAEYYLCGWGQVIESVVPAGVKKKAGTRTVRRLQAAPEARSALDLGQIPPKQRGVLEIVCASELPLGIDELSNLAQCGTGPINALRKKGLILAVDVRTLPGAQRAKDHTATRKQPDLALNADQQAALSTTLGTIRAGQHRTILLHGVTGSGKTEVYIQAIREVVDYGRQAIVLVPEISLTPQTISRFQCRFKSIAVMHSHLSDAERHWHWQQIASGAVEVVVGARSAVFAPTPHLGMIVIDEEHETTFKQETTPRYHAREVARQRAKLESVPLVLGSATPTLESWHRAQSGLDVLVSLPKRVEKRPLPPVIVVDVRNDPFRSRGDAIGRALRTAMQTALADDGQIILLQNLRGYSPVLWCTYCEKTVRCPHCDVTLNFHKDRNIVLCHSCEYESPPPSRCPRCDRPTMRYFGTGTQRLEREVQGKFPGVACLRMDSDAMRKPGSHDEALRRFREGEVRILLGTQMIAKGLDFPNVTLVGVIDADTMLHQSDLRAAERTFQLLSQVAGRTGRSERGGRVFIQSSATGEPAIRRAAEHDYLGFAAAELAHRREQNAPPFEHLTRVIARGIDERLVKEYIEDVAARLRAAIDEMKLPVRILGPASAQVFRIKNLFRYHLQLSSPQIEAIHALWHYVSAELPGSAAVEYVVDVDPLNMR